MINRRISGSLKEFFFPSEVISRIADELLNNVSDYLSAVAMTHSFEQLINQPNQPLVIIVCRFDANA